MAARHPANNSLNTRRNPQAYVPTAPHAPSRVRHTHSHSNSNTNPPPNRFLGASHPTQRPPSSYNDPTARIHSYQAHHPAAAGRAATTIGARSQASGAGPSSGLGRDGEIEIEDEEGGSCEQDDIIVRDESGAFWVDGGFGLGGIAAAESEDEEMEVDDAEDEAARRKACLKLIETYKSHSRQHIDLRELRAVIETSLLDKVASLEDDKWMYEMEPEPHDQR